MSGQTGRSVPSYSGGFPRYGGYPTYGGSFGYPGTSILSTNPYGGWFDPYTSTVLATADVIRAQAQFALTFEQARLGRQHARQAQLQTRRTLFDEFQYEQGLAPSATDRRIASQQEDFLRALNNPPVTEILSGATLNTMLDRLITLQAAGSDGSGVALDAETLRQVNVRPAGAGGHVGLLRDDGNLRWPTALRTAAYQAEVKQLNDLIPRAIRQAAAGTLDASTLNSLEENADQIRRKLTASTASLAPANYAQAKRFLNALDDALRALNQVDVAMYFNGRYEAKGETVADLVTHLQKSGLQFAPAIDGNETAYRALHQAMVTYAQSLTQTARK